VSETSFATASTRLARESVVDICAGVAGRHSARTPDDREPQVIKTRRNDRIIKVERRTLIGDTWRFEETLRDSEDSSKLNTSFVERLNLTIRQGSAYLLRRTICHARWKERLEDHLELFSLLLQLRKASLG
jgi:hypothetical protein